MSCADEVRIDGRLHPRKKKGLVAVRQGSLVQTPSPVAIAAVYGPALSANCPRRRSLSCQCCTLLCSAYLFSHLGGQ